MGCEISEDWPPGHAYIGVKHIFASVSISLSNPCVVTYTHFFFSYLYSIVNGKIGICENLRKRFKPFLSLDPFFKINSSAESIF